MLLLLLLAATPNAAPPNAAPPNAAPPNAATLSHSRAMRGALVEEVQYQQPAGEQPAELQLSQMTREQLRAEYKRLEENRPGLAGQITMVALGGATIAAGLLSLYVSFIFALIGGAAPTIPLIVGVGLVLGGGALLVVGIIMLKMALNERRPFSEAMDEITQRLEGTFEEKREDGLPPPPLPPADVPPPPPPPSASGFTPVRPSLVLATF